MERLLTLVEPVVIINKLGTSFFEMSLTLTVYNVSLETADGQVDQAQAASSRFFLIHSIICTVAAMLSTVPLGRVADRRGPKVFLIMSQLGSVMGMCVLLVFLFWKLPLEFLFLGSAVYGLSGGAPAYWAGVVALAALSSKQRHRTLKLNVVDLCYGIAGVLGGLLSGYVYQIGHKGVVLIGMAISFSVVSLLYSTFLLSGSVQNSEDKELLLSRAGRSERTNRAAVGLLISAMVLFMLGMIGAENILTLYVLKPPLSWDSVWAGYGRAATDAMYLSSFLGVLALSGVLGDTALTLLGIVSNCTGMAIMAFTMKSWVYFMARGIMLFACVPMPTMRAMLSKVLDAQQYGRIFGRLQLVLAVTELLSTVIFTSIYPLTLNSFSGLCFLLSCTISYLSVIPVLYLQFRQRREDYPPL
ncbi:thymic stromal cotransporter homolog [Astyanax mexicanus]|uniref:thymic stromal cotransporter homolog n=1 Tax=Astyanax mexicanus TaxID=7994 RepID=UPI0020CB3834|nr:thymic stromal cotransporter homolog [Astyanax mexicanus]XP_049321946.1 thymic stromal cotransporter homolog [Astyanax mexicanus]